MDRSVYHKSSTINSQIMNNTASLRVLFPRAHLTLQISLKQYGSRISSSSHLQPDHQPLWSIHLSAAQLVSLMRQLLYLDDSSLIACLLTWGLEGWSAVWAKNNTYLSNEKKKKFTLTKKALTFPSLNLREHQIMCHVHKKISNIERTNPHPKKFLPTQRKTLPNIHAHKALPTHPPKNLNT